MATKKRLVYANEVEEIFNYVENECSDSYNAFKAAIKNATTVDAVEVVRCKDCRLRKNGSLCYMISGCGTPVGTGDDFFCSYGERRT